MNFDSVQIGAKELGGLAAPALLFAHERAWRNLGLAPFAPSIIFFLIILTLQFLYKSIFASGILPLGECVRIPFTLYLPRSLISISTMTLLFLIEHSYLTWVVRTDPMPQA